MGRAGAKSSILRESVSAGLRGAAAGLLAGTLGTLLFGLFYWIRRDYPWENLPHLWRYFVYFPLVRVLPLALVLGAAAGVVLRLLGRWRKVTIAALAPVSIAALGYMLNQRLHFQTLVGMPFPVALGAAAAVTGLLLFLIWGRLERLFARLRFGPLTLAVGVPVLVFLLWTFLGHPAHRLVSHKEYSDREFFQLFDRHAPGMDAVFRRVDAGDFPGAMEALAEHFRERPLPPRISRLEPATPAELEDAERAMAHIYWMSGFRKQEGEKIDWEGSSVRDVEYAYNINRHYQWLALSRAYLRTGDDRFVLEIVAMLHDWVERRTPIRWKDENSRSWRLCDTALRLRDTWIPVIDAIRGHPSLDASFWRSFLGSIHDQAELLSHFRTDGNHVLIESNGLIDTGLHFPEFKDASSWYRIGLSRLVQQTRVQVYPDGVHAELSPAYHRLAIQEFLRGWRIVKLHGIKPPDELSTCLQRMWEYLASVVLPNGEIPLLNDGAAANISQELREASALLDRPDLLYAGSAGAEGKEPAWKSRLFPQAGQAVMRTGWRAEDLYLIFDAGVYGGAHGHEDKLSVVCYAYGRPLLIDPGCSTYDAGDPYRAYFRSTRSHNTVLVDNRVQARWRTAVPGRFIRPYRFRVARPPVWKAEEAGEYVEGKFDEGYESSWREPLDLSVQHVRGVLFVRPDYWIILDRLIGEGRHRHTRLFQCAPGEARRRAEGGGVETCYPEGGNLLILPLEGDSIRIVKGSEKPVQGWRTVSYNVVEPSPSVLIEGESSLPCALVTVLFPYDEHVDWRPRVATLEETDGTIRLAIERPGGQDRLVWPAPGSGAWKWEDLEGDGTERLALVRTDAEGRTRSLVVKE